MADLSGIEAKEVPTEVIVDELNSIYKWAQTPDKDRTPRKSFTGKYEIPRIHGKIVIAGSGAVKKFINDIKFGTGYIDTRGKWQPDSIVGSNEKMEKSGNNNHLFVKVGLPAFRGIIFDEEKKKFFVVNTCPGAGECVRFCYALKGGYVQGHVAFLKPTKALNLLINHPDKFREQLKNELRKICQYTEAYHDTNNSVTVRYNESGDFFSTKYMKIANDVMKELQSEPIPKYEHPGYRISATAYTKLSSVMNAEELDAIELTFSDTAKKGEIEKLKNPEGTRIASLLRKNEFTKFFNKVPGAGRRLLITNSGMEKLKQSIAQKRGIPLENIKSYQEIMQTPIANEKKYYVIVLSGAGDDAVSRPDVKEVILGEH